MLVCFNEEMPKTLEDLRGKARRQDVDIYFADMQNSQAKLHSGTLSCLQLLNWVMTPKEKHTIGDYEKVADFQLKLEQILQGYNFIQKELQPQNKDHKRGKNLGDAGQP